jgi:hypothetical protein
MTVHALECASYTHARRHPLVLGKIGGWSPPIQLSMAQVAVLVGSYVTLLWGWSLWAHGPGALNLIVLAGGPWLPTWALRAVRIEGRDPLRCAIGLLAYLSAPRRGLLHGKPVTSPRPSRLHGARFVTTSR